MIVAMGLLVVLFILLPIAEIYVIVRVGEAIGILPTLALLIVDGFLGAALARSQGRAAWARFNRALGEGRVPAREVSLSGDNAPVRLYDTSGPQGHDVRTGLPKLREMAAKVVARHLVGDLLSAVADLRTDPVPRVRAAADRAVARLTGKGA